MTNAKNIVIAQIILSQTDNEIIKLAVKQAVQSNVKEGFRFGSVVMEMMPEPESDDDFFFSNEDSKESEAREELSRILDQINRDTDYELNVVVDQEIVITTNFE